MNDQKLTRFISSHLTEKAGQLSYKNSHRLALARKEAVKAASLAAVGELAKNSATPTKNSTLALPGSSSANRFGFLLNWIPALLLVAGLIGIANTLAEAEADGIASEDVMLLIDDLPPGAYADNGFGVFIKNTRETSDAISGNP